MFAAASLFFSSKSGTLVKNLLGLLAIAAVLFAVYEWGHSNGYEAGYKDAVKADAPVIAKLTSTINTERQAVADKAATITKTTSDSTIAAVKDLDTKSEQRTQIVVKYIHDNPVQASECEISPQTVSAINDMLALQKVYDVPDPGADTKAEINTSADTTAAENVDKESKTSDTLEENTK